MLGKVISFTEKLIQRASENRSKYAQPDRQPIPKNKNKINKKSKKFAKALAFQSTNPFVTADHTTYHSGNTQLLWGIPHNDQIRGLHKPLPTSFGQPSEEGQPTIFNPKYLINHKEASELFEIIGTSNWQEEEKGYRLPPAIVILNRYRQVLHAQGIMATIYLRNLDDQNFVDIVCALSKLTLAYIKEPKQAEILSKMKFKFETPKGVARLIANPDVKAKIQDELEKVKFILAEKKLENVDAYKVAKHLVVNDLYRAALEDTILAMSQEVFDKWYEKNKSEVIHKVPHFSAEERLFVTFCGGPATGKSKTAAEISKFFEDNYGIPLSHAVSNSTDVMRLILIHSSGYGKKDPSLGSNAEHHGYFTQVEARFLMEKAMRFINKLLKETGKAPITTTECFEPSQELYEFANGAKMYISWALYGPFLSLNGDLLRYLDQNERRLPAPVILGSQKRQKDAFVRFMHKSVDKPIHITLFDTYPVIQHKVSTDIKVAEVDCEKRIFKIYNLIRLLDLFKFSKINTKAKFFSEIYPSKIHREVDFMKDLIAEFLTSRDYNIEFEYQGTVYAKLCRDNKFEITDNAVYKHLCSNILLNQLFKLLENTFLPDHTVSESLQNLGWKP